MTATKTRTTYTVTTDLGTFTRNSPSGRVYTHVVLSVIGPDGGLGHEGKVFAEWCGTELLAQRKASSTLGMHFIGDRRKTGPKVYKQVRIFEVATGLEV